MFINANRCDLLGDIVARDRPLNLVVVERIGQPPVSGFLVAVRASADSPLERLPPHLTLDWLEGDLGADVLVMALADEQRAEIAAEHVRRVYRPNRLGLPERLALLWTRLFERLAPRGPGGNQPLAKA